MQVSDPNNIKIYNLSAGKSLPEWLSEKKRRALLKKNVDIRRRIELIQDFDMPDISNSVRVSRDGQYILATGIYKPRVKCFDVNNLSLKFERCFDSEAVTFEVLSDDYSKLVFLQNDRYIEFHASFGRLERLRIPKYGRDFQCHYPSCDLFIVGVSPDIYRLNLERGQFMTPYTSGAFAINKCTINPVHHLLICGTEEGRVEAWDPRSPSMVASLDCAFACVNESKGLERFPSISALKFNGALQMGVGTESGHILLYDIRSNKPFCVKDHMYGLPIKDIEFHYQQDLVFSMDSSVLKIWDKNNGKAYTSIESSADFNNLCTVPNTGLLFIANEGAKIQTYYIPSMGPAPKWASFLDSLTEELEESRAENVYDDYKFVTKQELTNLGLDHLVGTNILRAYMHGYFMDVRLYKKARSVANPFEFQEYRKKKIRETIEKERANRVQVNKLPSVNKELALKLMEEADQNKKKKEGAASLLKDNRFKALFENPDFEIDKNSEEYRLLNPVLSKLDKDKSKKLKQKLVSQEFEPVEEELEGKNSSDESEDDDSGQEDSSDDDHTWTKEVKQQHRIIKREQWQKELKEKHEADRKEEEERTRQPKLYELRQGEEFKGIHSLKKKMNRATLGERVLAEDNSVRFVSSVGNREMTFSTYKKKNRSMDERNRKHREERKQVVRPLRGIKSKSKTNFFNRKRK
nr:nucleolar protein 10 [Leptinotarsa decemlineata]